MAMEIKSKGFDLEAELAGLARRKGFDHVEVQVDWSQRKGGTSKLLFSDRWIHHPSENN